MYKIESKTQHGAFLCQQWHGKVKALRRRELDQDLAGLDASVPRVHIVASFVLASSPLVLLL